jgi:hypothetical protein
MESIPRGHVLPVVPVAQIRTAHHPHHLVAQEATAAAAEVIDRIPHHHTLTEVVLSRGVVIVEDEEVTALLLTVVEVIAVAATPQDHDRRTMMMMTINSVPRQGRLQLQAPKIMLVKACVRQGRERISTFHPPLPPIKIMKWIRVSHRLEVR